MHSFIRIYINYWYTNDWREQSQRQTHLVRDAVMLSVSMMHVAWTSTAHAPAWGYTHAHTYTSLLANATDTFRSAVFFKLFLFRPSVILSLTLTTHLESRDSAKSWVLFAICHWVVRRGFLSHCTALVKQTLLRAQRRSGREMMPSSLLQNHCCVSVC